MELKQKAIQKAVWLFMQLQQLENKCKPILLASYLVKKFHKAVLTPSALKLELASYLGWRGTEALPCSQTSMMFYGRTRLCLFRCDLTPQFVRLHRYCRLSQPFWHLIESVKLKLPFNREAIISQLRAMKIDNQQAVHYFSQLYIQLYLLLTYYKVLLFPLDNYLPSQL